VSPQGNQTAVSGAEGEPTSDKRHFLPVIFIALALVLAVGAGLFFWNQRNEGTVMLLVRDAEGGSTLEFLSLSTKSMTPVEGADADALAKKPSGVFTLPDGSTISITPSGVVRQGANKGPTTLLVASAVPATEQTPFAVWQGGARIAWINPSDGSLQVFERSDRGTYAPLYLSVSVKANSLGFTQDGSVLVIAKAHVERQGPITTEISTIKVGSVSETARAVATISGFARIITP
jgi:hypothetical protein